MLCKFTHLITSFVHNQMVSFERNDYDTFIEHASDEDLEFSPRIGPEYQAEIPSLIEKSDQLSLRTDPTDSEDVHDKSLSSAIGLPIPITWSIADTNSFVLGLFIFGKNFTQIKRFIENKRIGEILSFYYGKFYETDGYRRWSECRKLKGRKCMIGKKLFAGARQQELLARLIPHVSDESQDTFLQVSKSYVEGRTSLEEYISYLKSTVGLGVLVEAVSIGKEKGDLTRLEVEPRKNSLGAFSAQTCKALSSFGPSDIIQSLTGGFRLSKTKSDDLFWEAVWPRLLARGWHSEQPMYQGYVTSKDYLVFLIPGIEKFSRRKLVKGDHYFDSVSDVLNKVVAEPNILELEEEESKVHSCNEEEPEKGSNEDDLSDDHRQCYLKPRSFTYNKYHIKLMGIDTSLVHKGKPSDFRDLKVPVNSVRKVEADAAGVKDKGQSYTRNVKHSKDMSKSIKQNSKKLTVIDTYRFSEGKLLKKMKQPKYPSVELEDASRMTTNLLKESKGISSTDDSRRMVEAKMLICGKQKINKTDSDPNKMVESQKNQHTSVFDDNRMKRIIKHEFNQRVISGDSNHAAVPIKRRRLTACVKAEKSHITENSSVGLGSDKLGFSRSSSFRDANQNVCHSVTHQQQQKRSFTASLADRSVEENNEKSILKDCCQRKSVPFVQVEKCKSSTFNRPKIPSKSVNIKTMATAPEEGEHGLETNDPCLASATQEVVEELLRTPCDVDSLEQQPDINPRRQSTRNRSLTVRALECIANEFLHVQSRHKRRDTH